MKKAQHMFASKSYSFRLVPKSHVENHRHVPLFCHGLVTQLFNPSVSLMFAPEVAEYTRGGQHFGKGN